MFFRPGATVAVLVVTLSVAGDALAADQMITARSGPDRFDPADVTIDVGDTVTFTNASGTHSVSFGDGMFDMPADAEDSCGTVARTFATAGSFSYLCEEHPTSMTGTVTVLGGGAPGSHPVATHPAAGRARSGTEPAAPGGDAQGERCDAGRREARPALRRGAARA